MELRKLEKISSFDKIARTINSKRKQKIFWDVDDVILDSANTVIKIINKKYGDKYGDKYSDNIGDINGIKTERDLKDYGMASIWKGFSGVEGKNELRKIFESDEFWSEVKVNEEFAKMIETGEIGKGSGYDNYIVTKGGSENHKKKMEFLKRWFERYDRHEAFCKKASGTGGKFVFDEKKYIALGLGNGKCSDKSSVDMSGGIQIDDVFGYLENTNAKVKLLVKNGRDCEFNLGYGVGEGASGKTLLDNLYICWDMKDVEKILKFNSEEFKL